MAIIEFEVEAVCTCGNKLIMQESCEGEVCVEPCETCLKNEKDAVFKVGCNGGLDHIADKFTKHLCKDNSCSDSDNNQYPECLIKPCRGFH